MYRHVDSFTIPNNTMTVVVQFLLLSSVDILLGYR